MDYLKKIPSKDLKEFAKRFETSETQIKSKAEDLVLYCESKGKIYKNYRSFLLNALKSDLSIRRVSEPTPNNVRTVSVPDKIRLDKIRLDKTNTTNVCFEKFWKEYPRKIGKQLAYRTWKTKKLSPLLETIVSAIQSQKGGDQWQKENGKYIPHPTTWLNRGGWEDEVIKSTKSKILRIDTGVKIKD